MIETVAPLLADFDTKAFLIAALAGLVGGIVRGFSGFGAAAILVPAWSMIYPPAIAIPLLLLVDYIVTAWLIPGASRHWTPRHVLPMAVGAVVLAYFGGLVLVVADAEVLRVVMSLSVFGALVVMISGWRFSGVPPLSVTIGTGAVSGAMGTAVGIGGPPVMIYYLSGLFTPTQVRANIIVFFAFQNTGAALVFWWLGVLTPTVLLLTAMMVPVYALAIFIGSRMFGLASEQIYRRIAMLIIAVVATSGLVDAIAAML